MSRVALLAALPLLLCACSGGLSNEQMASVVEARRSTLNACYETALAQDPVKRELTGKAFLVIEPSGAVSSVHIEGDLPLPGLPACLREAIAGWEFPAASTKTRTSLPLLFEPQVVKAPAPAAP